MPAGAPVKPPPDEPAAARVVADTLAHYGRLDAMVCNAGVGTFQEAEYVEPAEWNRIFDTNVRGTFLLCRAAIPAFKAQQREPPAGPLV